LLWTTKTLERDTLARQKTIAKTSEKIGTGKNVSSSRLELAANIAMSEIIGLREGEEVLIVTNFDCDGLIISRALFDATKVLGGKPVMVIQEKKKLFDNAERLVLETMKAQPDVILSLSAFSGGKDPYGMSIGYIGRDGKKYSSILNKLLVGDRKIRSFWSPQVTVDMFERCVPIDYASMYKTAGRLSRILNSGKEVRLVSKSGTDAVISIDSRKALGDDRPFDIPGIGGNLPCGEVFISPKIEGVTGTFVFDGTITLDNSTVIPKRHVKVTMKDGYVDEISGGEEAKMLLNVVRKGELMAREQNNRDLERNARHIGELGIGLNPAAKMTGNLLEDEKLLKTVHIAIGSNYDFDANALIHQDCLIKEPDMWVDGRHIMKKGVLSV
jgi:hypothetical protein